MRLVPLRAVGSPGARQRTEIDKTKVGELEESILAIGLLHPPVVLADPVENPEWPTYTLVAGERRLLALHNLQAKGKSFTHDGETIPPDMIPITLIGSDLKEGDLLQAEFDENMIRVPLPWQDQERAIAAIHRARQAVRPEQTFRDTAIELKEKIEGTNATVGGTASLQSLERRVSRGVQLSDYLTDPAISSARTAEAAKQILYKKIEEGIRAEKARRAAKLPGTPSSLIELRNVDMLTELKEMDNSLFDAIICDPPYGRNIDKGGLADRVVIQHEYDDSPENAQAIIIALFHEGWRITKPRANLFFFLDPDNWGWAKEAGMKAGWEVFRTPIIWQKSHSEGMAPWKSFGPRRVYEMGLFATKGQRGMHQTPIDILDHPKVGRDVRSHGAEKPHTLLRELVTCLTMPGDYILDPCCGSGSTLIAAASLRRRALGLEISPSYYETATANIQRWEEENPNG